jgi:polysaccharide export outer membrane protein
MKNLFRNIIVAALILGASSCTPLEEVVYLQDKETDSVPAVIPVPDFTLIIKPQDVLSIQLFTINAEAFPGIASTIDKQAIDNRSPYEKGFVVDSEGNVDLPLIGSTHLAGLSLQEAKAELVSRFGEYMDDPVIIIKHLSFKITLLGEVRSPGVYYINYEKITLMEALGLAGDVSYFGDRENVKIVRKNGDNYEEIHVDLTGKDMLMSEAAFVYPDDVIYVKPTKRRNFANLNPSVAIVTSVVATLTLIWSVIVQANR